MAKAYALGAKQEHGLSKFAFEVPSRLDRLRRGDVFHSGGRQFASKRDPAWRILAAWVNGATLASGNVGRLAVGREGDPICDRRNRSMPRQLEGRKRDFA